MFLFKRGSVFQLEYFDENLGKIKRISTGEQTKARATKFVSQFQEKIRVKKKVEKIELHDFVIEYSLFAEQNYSDKYIKTIKLSFRMLEEYLDNLLLKDIESRKIEKFLMFVHRRAKYSADLYHRTLKASFNKAIQWGYLDVNPFNKIKLPKNVKHIPEFIGEKELTEILDLTEDLIIRGIFITAFYTGLRQSELVNLKWNSIDFNNKIITVRNSSEFTTKSKKERTIPMNKTIVHQMRKLKELSPSDYIFPNSNNYKFHPDTISHKFKKAVRAAKLSEAIHFHTLRHSFASNLVRKGVSLYVVKELLGHEDISTTQIYAHLDNSALVNAVNLL